MSGQTPDPRLIPNGHTLHWILDPGFDHGDLRIRYVDLRIATDTSPLDRMTGITVRGPRIVSDGVVTRGQFVKSMMLGALPEHLREQIIEAAKATRKPTVRHRDAITGQYVDADEAAADRYAANEAKQREEAEPDPLDEDDHRDRLDRDGDRLTRRGVRHWHYWDVECACGSSSTKPLADFDYACGPLAFAPEGESGAEEGGEPDDAVEPLLCPECGEGIDDHPVWDGVRFRLRCRLTAADIARALIEQAVKQAGGGRG